MIATITADLINSTLFPEWRNTLLPEFKNFGKEGRDWNLYRGDSFQIRIEHPEESLRIALLLKSIILQIENLDVRIAIGIGTETEKTKIVSQNSGSAYINSGRLLENLNQNIEIKTDFDDIDNGLNAAFALINALCQQWKPMTANFVKLKFQNPKINQSEMAKKLKTSQSNVSQTLARANHAQIEKYLDYYHHFIQSRL